MLPRFAHGPETITLGDLEVRRLGYGAMRLPGKQVWGEPDDPATAHAVLRRAIELGINFIDTAWYYGPLVANRLIVESLHPYPRDLVIATKLGAKRLEDKSWAPALTVDELREGVHTDLRTLKLEQLPLVHLRWTERAQISFGEALDVLIDMQKAGKIRHLALSNVTVEQLEAATKKTAIVAVQNMFNVSGTAGPGPAAGNPEAVLAKCEEKGIAFVPFFPLGAGAGGSSTVEQVAKRLNTSASQISIAWLLARSPQMLPIPGTSKISHLEENVGAVHVALDDATLAELSARKSDPQIRS
ncbi:MAG TPA: aldo/keto reductase [Kofleriaceae bacterium]|nr:aldo/keto reductase [Kofleriaceae bacterium]